MAIVETDPNLGAKIVADAKEYVLYSWSVQDAINPIAVAGAEGRYFWDYEGKRYLDFASQLVNVNIGHQHPRIVAAIKEQAERLCTIGPPMATEPRSQLARLLAEVTPGDLALSFFTNGGAEANENAIKLARWYTGRHKVIVRYRSYHGATAGSLTLTGDPRRWPSEPGIPGVVHVPDPYHGIQRGWDSVDDALARLDEVIQLEGPNTIAAFIIEPVTGTNGILVPPDGYLQGVRALCDKYGILLIADEVMSGFGRTGQWFAVDHWGVVPDILTMAKGLTSAYVPLGAVGLRRKIADHFRDKVFAGGLTYNSHPLACAAALATIAVYEEDGLVARARQTGELMAGLLADLAARHPSVGAVRSIGLFGIVELIRNRQTREPMAPFNGTSPEMAALNRFFRQEGLYTFVRWNTFFANPPLCIGDAELREGFDIIGRGLAAADAAVA